MNTDTNKLARELLAEQYRRRWLHLDAASLIGVNATPAGEHEAAALDAIEAALAQLSGNSGELAEQQAAPAAAGVPAEQQGAGEASIDVTDPWRGLYRAERLRANGDGDLYHPDLPSWPDDREDALDKLVRAQGFDFQVVAGEFTEEAAEDDGGELYWQEMRAWNPAAPEGGWRLAWKGDTEDGPYAWFVRPMALRPDPESLAARQPEGQEPADAKLLRLLRARAELPDSAELNYLRDGDGTGYAWWDRRRAELRQQGYVYGAGAATGVEYFFLAGVGDEIRAALAEHDAAPPAKAVPAGCVLVPLELADRVQDSLGRFTSDEGWGQSDMDAADDFSAYVAAPGAQEVGNG